MKTKEDVKDRLKEVLQSLDFDELEVSAELESGHRLVAVVTTPEFDGVDEAERQSTVWQAVYDYLEEDEQALISFIFTNTPAEEEDIEQEERDQQEQSASGSGETFSDSEDEPNG